MNFSAARRSASMDSNISRRGKMAKLYRHRHPHYCPCTQQWFDNTVGWLVFLSAEHGFIAVVLIKILDPYFPTESFPFRQPSLTKASDRQEAKVRHTTVKPNALALRWHICGWLSLKWFQYTGNNHRYWQQPVGCNLIKIEERNKGKDQLQQHNNNTETNVWH